ncbi:uncharacterized protein LOC105763928 [Gossypium raimondii]|uniref:uncharacterized protein LOC105763928 n=1 Tax=Gossypium raimondii TaxID=29730 RepID=UPI00227A46D6|nr:uncharacterized protein LOC105763928 [Gossypium raimondii]
MTEDRCLKCGQEAEDSNHVFQRCPIAKESWLTWVFSEGTNDQCRGFCCGLWITWTSRNKFLYEGKISTSWDISKQIKSYILELEGIRERELTLVTSTKSSQRLQRENTTIFFDAAFDSKHNRSASGLVVKEQEGKIVAAKSILHENVASLFVAEAYAGYQATMLGIQLGYLNVDILGDSKTITTKCQSENHDRSEIGAIISDIQGLNVSFKKSVSSSYQGLEILKHTE